MVVGSEADLQAATGDLPKPIQDLVQRLRNSEKKALVAFLESLSGDNVATLMADAFAAPVGDIQ